MSSEDSFPGCLESGEQAHEHHLRIQAISFLRQQVRLFEADNISRYSPAHAKSAMPSQMPPMLPSSLAAHHQAGGSSSSPRASPGVSQGFPTPGGQFASSQGFDPTSGVSNPRNFYSSAGAAGSSSSWQTQYPPSATGNFSGSATNKQGSSHISSPSLHAWESSPPSFQLPSTYHNMSAGASSFPPQWSNSNSHHQWVNSPSPSPSQSGNIHWPSGGMIGVSSPNSGGSRQASHAQLSALVPTSSSGLNSFHSPGGRHVSPPSGEGFSHINREGMESALQMPTFQTSLAGRGGGSSGSYPTPAMVITPKTDGQGAINLCDPLQVSFPILPP